MNLSRFAFGLMFGPLLWTLFFLSHQYVPAFRVIPGSLLTFSIIISFVWPASLIYYNDKQALRLRLRAVPMLTGGAVSIVATTLMCLPFVPR